MPGKLYVVGTPIGNLGDMSARGLETLREVALIAAEDTRVSLKLLRHFGIETPLISYHEHNKRERGTQLIARMAEGDNCAIITDAGMPCISDPGEDLVCMCAEAGIEIVTVPGPSAAISALAISGLPTGRFAFEGFLSVRKTSRFSHLEQVKDDRRTLIFYEAPHKLIATLTDMLATWGDRKIALAREITKLHEEVIRTTLSAALRYYSEKAPRGEYVVIIEGAAEPPAEEAPPLDVAIEMAKNLVATGERTSQAAKLIAKQTGHPRSEIYAGLH